MDRFIPDSSGLCGNLNWNPFPAPHLFRTLLKRHKDVGRLAADLGNPFTLRLLGTAGIAEMQMASSQEPANISCRTKKNSVYCVYHPLFGHVIAYAT